MLSTPWCIIITIYDCLDVDLLPYKIDYIHLNHSSVYIY